MTPTELARLGGLIGPVSRETIVRLDRFVEAFQKWNDAINLVAPSTIPHLWDRHILDSAQLVPLAGASNRWLDLGSGGGFPGAIVAILVSEHREAHVTLIESNRKKASFLQTTLGQLGVSATVLPSRIEAVEVRDVEILSARAVAPLAELLRLSDRWLSGGAKALFHKGRDYAAEVELARRTYEFSLVEHPSVLGDGMILEITRH